MYLEVYLVVVCMWKIQALVNYMHHFIFCKKDTYILNDEVLFNKNFALDNFLEVGTVNKLDFNYEDSILNLITSSNQLISENLINFTGTFTGSIYCSSGSVSGIINCISIGQPEEFVNRVSIIDDYENVVTDDLDNPTYISTPEDFYYFT